MSAFGSRFGQKISRERESSTCFFPASVRCTEVLMSCSLGPAALADRRTSAHLAASSVRVPSSQRFRVPVPQLRKATSTAPRCEPDYSSNGTSASAPHPAPVQPPKPRLGSSGSQIGAPGHILKSEDHERGEEDRCVFELAISRVPCACTCQPAWASQRTWNPRYRALWRYLRSLLIHHRKISCVFW
jgi:hypothetical protein